MSKATTVNRAAPAKPATTSHAGAGSEEVGRAEQAARRALVHQSRVATRAYELYEQQGRQEGRALEDWLDAESQLLGRAIQGRA
ncbi:MAG: DUF2934 domain-containing protein [Nitrospiraceae bacterium]